MPNNYYYFCSLRLAKYLGFFAALIICATPSLIAQPMTVKVVNAISNPLVDSLVGQLAGQGIQIQNVRCNQPQNSSAYGSFKNSDGTLGIPAGMAMTTGMLVQVLGPNGSANNASFNNNFSGDANGTIGNSLLAASLTSTTTLNNVCVIEFDFIPSSDTIEFSYVFGSEEYNSFVGSNFNDIFGLFIQGPGIVASAGLPPNTRNLARLPGTNQVVSINNVNRGFGITPASNPNFYINNTTATSDQPALPSPTNPVRVQTLNYDGFTRRLTARAIVTPCQVYKLIFAIADVSDGSFDSGVFIEKGSLRSVGASVVESSVFSARFPYSIEGCNNGKFIFKRCVVSSTPALTIRYQVSGTAQRNQDYILPGNASAVIDSFILAAGKSVDSLVVTTIADNIMEGEESIVLRFLDRNRPFTQPGNIPNFTGDSTVLKVLDEFVYKTGPDTLKLCYGDSVRLNLGNNFIRDSHQWSLLFNNQSVLPTSLSCNSCKSPFAKPLVTTRYIVNVLDSVSSCRSADTVLVQVYNRAVANFATNSRNRNVCLGDTLLINPRARTSIGAVRYSWFNTLPENPRFSARTDSILKVTPTIAQWYVVEMYNSIGCPIKDSIFIGVVRPPRVSFAPPRQEICFGDTITIKPILADTAAAVYTWLLNPVQPIFSAAGQPSIRVAPRATTTLVLRVENSACVRNAAMVLQIGDSISAAFSYNFAAGSDSIMPATVKFSSQIYPADAVGSWFIIKDNQTDTVKLSGISPTYTFTEPGSYKVNLKAVFDNGTLVCSRTETKTIRIVAENPLIANIITPNNDGKNDVFKIGQSGPGELTITNRWGKQVYQNDKYQNDWSGEGLPVGIYFYTFRSPKLRIFKKGWLQILR